MCGIAGYIGFESLADERIKAALNSMRRRGPDQQSFAALRQGETNIYLLHSRLSIIDLDARANQPFVREHATLVFNGEIYNYLELKQSLQAQGRQFSTASDTEVLIQSYLTKGANCVQDFEGMWAYALFDSKRGELVLSRDRFAEKPLYLFETPRGVYFASEIKTLQHLSGRRFSVNMRQVKRYLVNGYKSLYKHGDQFFNEVTEVPFASNLTIDCKLNKSLFKYWAPSFEVRPISLQDAIEQSRELLFDSVKLRLRSDVPLAFCLSGGIDSSALAAIAAKRFGCDVSTYSIIDPDPRYNELDNINANVRDLSCENTIIHLEKTRSLARLRDLVDYHDGPLATISYYVHSLLSERISADGKKVVFSGTGADEIFTGYYDHFNLALHELRTHPDYQTYLRDWQKHVLPNVRNPHLQQAELYRNNEKFREHIYLNWEEFASYLTEPFTEGFREEEFDAGLLRNRMANELYYEGTRVILHEDDLNSMRYSLENRSPYLDSRLVNFMYSVPTEHLMHDGFGKYILREALAGVLNDKVRLDRHKKGFNASIESVIDLDSSEIREELVSDNPIFELVQREKIAGLLSKRDLPNSFSKFLFNFVNVRLFLERNSI